jgi:type II secretory pathway component PulF
MPDFIYKAFDETGNLLTAEITAINEQDVINHLQKQNLTPIDIKKLVAKKLKKRSYRNIKSKDVIIFTKQLFTLLKSGVPILVCLDVIKDQTTNPNFEDIVSSIKDEVEQGNSLSDALAQFSKIFPHIYISSVKVGEVSGTLEETLEYLYHYLEDEDKIKKNIKKAFRYPIFVVSGLVVAFFILTTTVVPTFIPLFTSSQIELPVPTKILFTIYQLMSNHWLVIMLVVGIVASAIFLYVRTEKGHFQFHNLKLQFPLFGALLKKVYISQFTKTFCTMNRTGIPVIQIFDTLQSTVENDVYKKEIANARDRIKEGEGIAKSLSYSKYFSSLSVKMISIGEKSGALNEMLTSISEYYDTEVNESVENMTSLIEPVVTVLMGGMVLLFALAIFLPMWNMMSIIK